MSETIEDRFGRNLAAARTHRRMGQKDVAERAGLDQSYVSLIEAGKRTVGIDLAERLAAVVGVPLGTLLDAREPFASPPPSRAPEPSAAPPDHERAAGALPCSVCGKPTNVIHVVGEERVVHMECVLTRKPSAE